MNARAFLRACALICICILSLSACTRERGESPTIEGAGQVSPKIEIESPDQGALIRGNVVQLKIAVEGISIVKADGDTSGKSGHFHVFIDRDPTPVGEVIPKEAGVVHSAENPVVLTGLTTGEHRLVAVFGDGAHERIGNSRSEVRLKIEGPTVDATAAAEIASGSELTIEVAVEGVQVIAAASDQGSPGTTGHLHAIVDPATAPSADSQPIPKDDRNIHFAETSMKIPAALLTPGEHTIWIVLADKNHVPLNPLVADKITVTVK